MDEDDAHRNHQPPRPLEGAPAPPARGSSIRYDPLADRISGKVRDSSPVGYYYRDLAARRAQRSLLLPNQGTSGDGRLR